MVAGQPLMRVENSFFKSELAQASIDLPPSACGWPGCRRDHGREGRTVLARHARRESRRHRERAGAVPPAPRQSQRAAFNSGAAAAAEGDRALGVALPPALRDAREADLGRTLCQPAEADRRGRCFQQRTARRPNASCSRQWRGCPISRSEFPRTEAALAEIGQRKAEVTSRFQADAEKDRTTNYDGGRKTDQEH